jgi:hypothetical protein
MTESASSHVTEPTGHVTKTQVKPSTSEITGSSEYAVAVELEMWRLAEEEAFKVQ